MEHLHISTMTGIGCLSEYIDLCDLYNSLNQDDIIKMIQYKDNPIKGDKTFKKKKTTTFYNQLTILIENDDKIANVKVFNNGKIQMTGIKKTESCEKILNIIKNKIIELNLASNTKNINVISSNIVLINSDFSMGYMINPDILYREILNKGIFVTYEPCIYPGVNIKYYIRDDKEIGGICPCESQCNGKGKNGACKKVTIAVFNSGNIIITGANCKKQLVICYNFIKNMIDQNRELIEMKK